MSVWKDFHPAAETISTWFALTIIGGLAFAFVFFPVPLSNKELITFALGAIAGALTMGGRKVADKVTTTGDIQGDTVAPEEEK